MARSQRVTYPDGSATFTVIGADLLPSPPAEEYLAFLRADGAAPATVKAYAAGLADWFTVLEHTGCDWRDFPALLFGEFLTYLRTGDLPGTGRVGPVPRWLAASSVQLRSAAVLAFYRWHAAANGITVPYDRLYSPMGKRGRRRYVAMLEGVADRGQGPGVRPLYTVRSGPGRRTPLLTPSQVATVLDGCTVQDPDGIWSGSAAGLRDRLLFATLAETGMRLGETLGLHHEDWHVGGGGTPWVDVVPRQDHPHGARVKSGQHRRVYIGDDLEALYADYVWALVDAGADLAVPELDRHFVFVNTAAGELFAPMRVETVYAKVRSLTRRHRQTLPQGWTPHWLRHTHATALLLAGCPPHVVMRRLGHLDVQTTLSAYGWVTEDAELRAVADWRNYVAGWKGLTHAAS